MAFVGDNEVEQYATGLRSNLHAQELMEYHNEYSIESHYNEVCYILNEEIEDTNYELERLATIIGADGVSIVETTVRHTHSPLSLNDMAEWLITYEDYARMEGELIEEGDPDYIDDGCTRIRMNGEVVEY